MQPVYFPLTYLSQKAARKAASCFSNTVVFQALKSSTEPKSFEGLETVAPVSGDEESLLKAIQSYKSWAELHQGESLVNLKARMDEIPFYSDQSISKIKTDIQKRSRHLSEPDPKETKTPEQALFTARLFLAMAHEHDASKDQIQNDLEGLGTLENKLFHELKGETEDFDEGLKFAQAIKSPMSADPAEDYLVKQRISAWARLALADSRRPFVYITTSRTALDSLADAGRVKTEPLLSIEGIPLTNGEKLEQWKQDLMKVLEDYALNPTPSATLVPPPLPMIQAEDTVTLTVHTALETNPERFLNQLAGIKESTLNRENSPYHQTLVCLVS
ncbi:MAG: hypothetical protein KKF30_06090 [Proteobacteria bacterium]|nr:hypothetical protein [Pseudomonadota bacterium]MBU4471991.1 hypothetical protein [Pseudomonadota bacterium]MCG2753459.1 hypothetical protein [Desulfobacteraceae bacterium]